MMGAVPAGTFHLVQESSRATVARGEIPRLWSTPRSAGHDFPAGSPAYHLRVGDSMVTGEELTRAISARFPRVAQAEIGVPGSGTDLQFYLLSRFLDDAGAPPRLVTHHLFVGNDLGDLDCNLHFCGGAGILAYRTDGVVPCPHLSWTYSPGFVVAESQPPFVLSWASDLSSLARIGLGAVRRVANRDTICHTFTPDDPRPPDWDERWSHLEAILRSERDLLGRLGVPLVVTVIPQRRALESRSPAETPGYQIHQRMLATLDRLAIPRLDAWPPLRDAVSRDGSGPYFQPNGDVHFSLRGKELFADWLAAKLGADLEHAPVSPGGGGR
jgi:hypothetical protein